MIKMAGGAKAAMRAIDGPSWGPGIEVPGQAGGPELAEPFPPAGYWLWSTASGCKTHDARVQSPESWLWSQESGVRSRDAYWRDSSI